MKFNQRQKDAIAKVLENVGTACIIALFVGSFIESKVALVHGIGLGALSILFVAVGIFIRKGD